MKAWGIGISSMILAWIQSADAGCNLANGTVSFIFGALGWQLVGILTNSKLAPLPPYF